MVSLPAGAWVDRSPRRPLMIIWDVASALLYASLPAAAWPGVLTIGQVVIAALAAGRGNVFFSTAYQAYRRLWSLRRTRSRATRNCRALADALIVRDALWVTLTLYNLSRPLLLTRPLRRNKDLPKPPTDTVRALLTCG